MITFNNPPPQESEDCLYLNVFAPSTPPPPGGYPVMFWIYGGALEFGNAGQPGYDGSSLASFHNVIIVTSNYRTNVFGFPSAPSIPITQRNLGFYDQRAGLAWVQQNIHAFGGDKEKVTIFGQSAGAASCDALLLTFPPPSRPPFRAAILESGSANANSPTDPNNSSAWDALLKGVGCDPSAKDAGLACARSKPATVLENIIEEQALSFTPVADGITFPKLANGRETGQIARVPIMVGTTRNDSSFFVLGETDFDAVVEATFPGNTSAQQAAKAVFGVGGTLGLDSVFDAVSVFSSTQGLCVSPSYSLTVLLCLKFWEVIYLYG
jgi:carboxylesterase type B